MSKISRQRHGSVELGRYIVVDPMICHGKPTFKGTRVFVADVLADVERGLSWDFISQRWGGGKIPKAAITEAVRLARAALLSENGQLRFPAHGRVNLLDENIPLDQRDILRAWGIRCRVVGQDIAQLSVADDNLLVLLHRLKQPTFFTRDQDFFKRELCHPAYGLVWLDAVPEEAALFVRRMLKHPRFATKAGRMGMVARAHHDGIQFWQRHRPILQRAAWNDRP